MAQVLKKIKHTRQEKTNIQGLEIQVGKMRELSKKGGGGGERKKAKDVYTDMIAILAQKKKRGMVVIF